MAAGTHGLLRQPAKGNGMASTYHSGDEVHQGDLVTYGGNAGMIELVVDGASNPETDWHFENCGAGVMVVEPKVFGRLYVHAPHEDEDLVFVGRAQ